MKLTAKQTNLQTQLYQQVVTHLQTKNITNPTETTVRKICYAFLEKEVTLLPETVKQTLITNLTYAVVGLGPLEFLLRDDTVSEIMVNGPETIFIEQNGKLQRSALTFLNEEQLRQVIGRIVGQVGRRIDESTPLVDARLADGSRVNAIIPPLSLNSSVLTIRKFPQKAFTLDDMLTYGSVTDEMAQFLRAAVRSKQNIVISGGTGAGKTSTLNALASLIPAHERIITIEDAAEIRIEHPHLISLESRPANLEGTGAIPIRALLKNALRMRPDRIVVGEIRGGEAIDMLQAMNTGHKGSLTTVHANSPLESLFRIETMVLMGDVELPIAAIRPQVSQAIDIVVQQMRLSTGERKITAISEVATSPHTDEYVTRDIFRYDEEAQTFLRTEHTPAFRKRSITLTP